MTLICSYCGRDIDAIGQDNMSDDLEHNMCEDCRLESVIIKVDFGPGGEWGIECTDPDPVDDDVEYVCDHWKPIEEEEEW